MRRFALVAGLVAGAIAAGAPTAAAAGGLSVSVDRTEIRSTLGHTFVFRSTISNRGATSAGGLVAHLNVLSLRGDIYVDPEDWSSHRTRYLPPIPAGGSTTLIWKLSAVNAGHLGVYVAVLPRTGAGAVPSASPAVNVTIADRKTLNSGGILPLALGVPALLATLILVLRVRRRAGFRSAL